MCDELKMNREERMKELQLTNAKALRSLLGASAKSVLVEIDACDLHTLKEAGYSLCFAKKVGNYDYNVIWKSMDKYLECNTFSWTPIYQIFATNTFQDGLQVVTSVRPKNIGLGEITILDSAGTLSEPVTGGDSTAINADNEYGNIHFGISQMSTNEKGNMEATPIYVSKNVSVLGKDTFTPVEKVMVWFQCDVKTSTMFANMQSNAIEIDLTMKSTASVRYENGIWGIIG